MRKEGWPPVGRPDPELQSTHRSSVSQPRGVSQPCSTAHIQAVPACWFIAAAQKSQLPRTYLGKLTMCQGRCKQLKSSAVENSWAPRAVLPGTGLPGQGPSQLLVLGEKCSWEAVTPAEIRKGLFLYNWGASEGETAWANGGKGLTPHQLPVALVYLLRPVFWGSQGQLPVVHFRPFSRWRYSVFEDAESEWCDSPLVTERPVGYRSYVCNFTENKKNAIVLTAVWNHSLVRLE